MAKKMEEGVGYKKSIHYPCSKDAFREIQDIIDGMRILLGEFLVVDLECYPNRISFLQTTHMDDAETYLVEAGIDLGKTHSQIYRMTDVTKEACLRIFYNICVLASAPDFSAWQDVTEIVFSRIADEQETNEKEDTKMMIEDRFENIDYTGHYTLHHLPANEKQIDGMLQLAEAMEHDSANLVHLTLTNHDDPRDLYFARQGNGYKMIMSFPMDDFDWDHPLVLESETLTHRDVKELLVGILSGKKSTSDFPVVNRGFHNITDDIYPQDAAEEPETDEPDDDPEEDEADEQSYSDYLDELLTECAEEPGNHYEYLVLGTLFEGIRDNNMLSVPVKLDEDGKLLPMWLKTKSGKIHFAAFSKIDLDQYKLVATMSLRDIFSAIDREEECTGIVLNPFEKNEFFVPKFFLIAALSAGYRLCKVDAGERE